MALQSNWMQGANNLNQQLSSMERVIKFRAIIHLDEFDILMPAVAVYPNNQIGFDSEVFGKLLPKHHYIDWDDNCIRRDDEEAEIFENVLSILTGDDWIWLDDSFTLQQFTGLTDKNGKEIYEGDILKVCNGSINTVPWMENPYDVKYIVNKGFTLPMFCWDRQGKSIMDKTHWCEVIGNIYENPELLNQH